MQTSRLTKNRLLIGAAALWFVFNGTSLSFAQIGIWTSAAELAAIPMSGPAWDAVLNGANQDCSNPDVSNQNDNTNIYVLAAGIVYARTGEVSYKNKVVGACEKLVAGGQPLGETLAWARETGAYAMAADLVGYRTPTFKTWLRNMAEVYVAADGRTMLQMFKKRPNNWGARAFGSLSAIYRYLGDNSRLNEIRDYWMKGLLGPNPGYSYGSDLSWHVDPNNLRLINPKGAIKQGMNIDGIIPDDMRRGGPFQNPPLHTGYPWGFMQGQVMAARILERAGLSIWAVGDSALYRAAYALQVRLQNTYGGWSASGDDEWMLPFLDKVYGTHWSGSQPNLWKAGKNAGWGYVTLGDGQTTLFMLTVNRVGSGSVALNPLGGAYSQGTTVTLTAIPASGWLFSGWSGDLSGSANPAAIVMSSNKSVTAIFKQGGSDFVPTMDAYVASGPNANNNYNFDPRLKVKDAPGDKGDLQSYMKFDLTGVSGSVASATLKLYCQALPDRGTTTVEVYSVANDNWNEATITWNNAPPAGTLLASRTDINKVGVVYTFNVTGFVAAQAAGDKVVTLLIKDHTSRKKAAVFGSRESSTPPILTVTAGVAKSIQADEKATDDVDANPATFQLKQNYPNPFKRTTSIGYTLPQSGYVNLVIYDINGRFISTLFAGVQQAGTYSFHWEAFDARRRLLPNGIYFCRLQAGTQVKTIKLLMVR